MVCSDNQIGGILGKRRPSTDKWLSTKDAAEWMNMPISTFRRYAFRNEIEPKWVGRKLFWYLDDVREPMHKSSKKLFMVGDMEYFA
jgi:hypothetical protein